MADTLPAAAKVERSLPTVPWLDERTMLAFEKDVLGFHVSGHPLDQHQRTLATFCNATIASLSNMNHDATVIVGGVLSSVRPTFVKQGKSAGEKMAMITLQDKTGQMDGVVFSSVFAKCGAAVQGDSIVLVIGRVDKQRGEPQIIADNVIPAIDAPKHLAGRIEVDVMDDARLGPIESRLQMLSGYLQQANASATAGAVNGWRAAEVLINLHCEGKRYALKCGRVRAIADSALLQNLVDVAGDADKVRMVSAGPPKRAEDRNGQRWRKPQMAEA
jgi:DNA polymerase-3 subunit alpha